MIYKMIIRMRDETKWRSPEKVADQTHPQVQTGQIYKPTTKLLKKVVVTFEAERERETWSEF